MVVITHLIQSFLYPSTEMTIEHRFARRRDDIESSAIVHNAHGKDAGLRQRRHREMTCAGVLDKLLTASRTTR